MLCIQLSLSHFINMMGHTFLAVWQSNPTPHTLLGWEGSFEGSVPFNDTVNLDSVLGIKHGDSDVLIQYQVDEFTHLFSKVLHYSMTHLP